MSAAEAYLELIDITNVDWQHRAHFFAVSAQIMRHILLDRARRRVAAKRGGNAERVDLDELPSCLLLKTLSTRWPRLTRARPA